MTTSPIPIVTGGLPIISSPVNGGSPPAVPTFIGRWRFAIFSIFFVNGLVLGTWASRTPAVASSFDFGPAQIGVLITAIPVGAFMGLLLTSHVLERFGERRTAIVAQSLMAVGLAGFGLTATILANPFLGAVALFVYGIGIATTNIVINLEAAASDRASGRTLMPLFHAAWSVGAFVGAGLGAFASAGNVTVGIHFSSIAVVALTVSIVVIRWFVELRHDSAEESPGFGERMRVWVEPRTLLIGVIVLAASFTEGTANSWLNLAMVTGRDWSPALGAAAVTVFTAAMFVGRIFGGSFVDRVGRVSALRWGFTLAAVGLLVVLLIESQLVVFVGVALWGLGASLGYPLGMSAASDDPRNAAARVAAVATVSTISGLVGPSVLGLLGEYFGLPEAFVVVVVLIALGLLVSSAARPPKQRLP
ncbi:MAG: MFS transporter [Microbacteriaceae bacterium]